MSSKQSNAYADSEYLRAAIIQKEQTEHEWNVVVRTTISMRRHPSVLVIRIEAFEKDTGPAEKPLAAYEVLWPNSYTMGLTATLLQAHGKLDCLVQETRTLDEWFKAQGGR